MEDFSIVRPTFMTKSYWYDAKKYLPLEEGDYMIMVVGSLDGLEEHRRSHDIHTYMRSFTPNGKVYDDKVFFVTSDSFDNMVIVDRTNMPTWYYDEVWYKEDLEDDVDVSDFDDDAKFYMLDDSVSYWSLKVRLFIECNGKVHGLDDKLGGSDVWYV